METRPTVAFTVARGPGSVAAARFLRATFAATHPDVPFFLVEGEPYAFFAQQREVGHVAEIVSLRTVIGWFLSLHFPRVIYLDADVVVLDRLERLLDWPDRPEAEAALTNDVSTYDYGLAAPVVNAGILAARGERFWKAWMLSIYSCLVPIGPNFFDQFSLRLLAQAGAVPVFLLPEREERDFYNISYREHPGDWTIAGGAPGGEAHVRKGDARVRLWHWAGAVSKTSLDALPEPVRRVALARVEQGKGRTTYEEDNRLLRLLIDASGAAFLETMAREFAALQTVPVDGLTFADRTPPPGLYASDAPAAWDARRPPVPGLHRRLLRRVPRYVYARDPERLLRPDVDALDVPPGIS